MFVITLQFVFRTKHFGASLKQAAQFCRFVLCLSPSRE